MIRQYKTNITINTMRKPTTALLAVMLFSVLAMLACTSNDTLFIHLTETPIPTLTPTPLSIQTKFQINEKATVVGVSDVASINLASVPGPFRPAMSSGACFPNTVITILDVAQNTSDPSDPAFYYQILCSGGKKGWLSQKNLSKFTKYAEVIIKSPDGKGVTLLKSASQKSAPASTTPCADGTKVKINVLKSSTDDTEDTVYAQIRCGGKTGFVSTDVLVAAS
jgi:hypothetical protein